MIIDGLLKIMIEIIHVHVNVWLEYRYFLLNDSRKRTKSEPNSLLGLFVFSGYTTISPVVHILL
jgi:hypothetical protein